MPKIIVDLNIDEKIKNAIINKLKNKKLLIEDYILDLIENDINSEITFNDYSYNFIFDKLFYKNKEIKLTNIELKLFKCLIENVNSLVTLDEIESKIWKDKKMSIFSLRNKINSIRDKTYYKLIKNISNHGYMMVIEDN